MGGITCNAEGFAGETGAVDVLEGGERDTNDLLSCSRYPLKDSFILLLVIKYLFGISHNCLQATSETKAFQ